MEKIVKKTVCFDVDGTLNLFYNVDGWLDDILNENPRPYLEAKPKINFSALAKQIHRLQKIGYEVNIISWLARDSRPQYDKLVIEAKLKWLKIHLPSVEFDNILIVPYGTPKSTCGCGILFDDEEKNRKEWNIANDFNLAFDVDNILEILRGLI